MSKDEAWCPKCQRYESRPQYVKTGTCSLCKQKTLVPGPHTNY